MSGSQKIKQIHSFLSEAARQAIEPIGYAAGIHAYAIGAKVAALKNRKAALMTKGQRETWHKLASIVDPSREKWIWVHAASLGEFEQGRPVIERIKKEMPGSKILLTFFSPSGYEVRKNYQGADCICYLPFDTPRNARRFVEMVRPEAAIFIKYEIWRNYLRVLSETGVPVYLISAVFRPDQLFFKRRGAWYRYWLHYFRKIFVQDTGSRDLLGSYGIASEIAGDTRFDRVAEIASSRKEVKELSSFLASPRDLMMVVGSSWPEDEEVYLPWLNEHKNVKAIIAPHEFDSSRLERLRKAIDGKTMLLSELKNNPDAGEEAKVVIVDCFGLLSGLYGYGDIAYVGGGFGAGIHNINEAAVYGIPVIFGPRHDKFIEAKELAALGGGLPVGGKNRFEEIAGRLLFDIEERQKRGKWAADYIKEKQGATTIIFNSLFGK